MRAGPAGRALLDAASWVAPVFAVAVITYLPWYVTFSSQADGLYPYIGKGTIPAHAFRRVGRDMFGRADRGMPTTPSALSCRIPAA